LKGDTVNGALGPDGSHGLDGSQVLDEEVATRWDVPADEVGPWWLLPGWGAPIAVRRSQPLGTLSIHMTERFVVQRRRVLGETGHRPLHPGDTVIWVETTDDAEFAVTYPQRVVSVAGPAQVWTLVDQRLSTVREVDAGDGGLLAHALERGCALGGELRQLLEFFQLNVICPLCATPGQQVRFGLPAGPPEPWVSLGGCIVGPDEPLSSYSCVRCETKWYVDADGRVQVTDAPPGAHLPTWVDDVRDRWR